MNWKDWARILLLFIFLIIILEIDQRRLIDRIDNISDSISYNCKGE